jgi:hypothetical protein
MAWTIVQTVDERVTMRTSVSESVTVVKLVCTVDGSSSGTVEIQPDDFRKIHGTWLYMIKLQFVDADVNFNFDVVDKDGDAIVNTAANAFGATTFLAGSVTCGVYPPILDYCGVIIDGTGAITNAKKLNVFLYFVK